MSLEKDIILINTADENDVLNLILGALISAETLSSIDACTKSIDILNGFIAAVPYTNVKDKEECEHMMRDCLKIVTDVRNELQKDLI